jgi:hypothetical protein
VNAEFISPSRSLDNARAAQDPTERRKVSKRLYYEVDRRNHQSRLYPDRMPPESFLNLILSAKGCLLTMCPSEAARPTGQITLMATEGKIYIALLIA